MDVSAACSGSVYGLYTAHQMVANGDFNNVLLIGTEVMSTILNWDDRNTCVLFGDAAGAAIVGRGPNAAEVLAANAGTDGTKSDILGLEAGGTRVPFSGPIAEARLHQKLVMNGREVFKEAVGRMTTCAHELLAEAGLSLDDVSLVVPHQANLRILNAVRDRLGLPDEKVFSNVHEYGNTGSASVPVALWEARTQGRIKPGDLVLLTAFGAGFHWSGVLVRF